MTRLSQMARNNCLLASRNSQHHDYLYVKSFILRLRVTNPVRPSRASTRNHFKRGLVISTAKRSGYRN